MTDQMPTRRAHVTGWGRYAPEQVLTNADLERMVDTSDEWIVSRTGIRERRVAAAHETTASMAAVAGAAGDPDGRHRARRHRPHPPRHPDARLLDALDRGPGQGGHRQHRAAAMDVAAACSGFVYAYATAQAYIAGGLAKHVLVIGAELLTRFLDYTDRSTCILFGDGAGAVVLSASDEPGGGARHRADDRAPGRLHDLAARRRREEPALGRDDRPRRALHPDGGQGDVPVRDADAGLDRARPSVRKAGSSRPTSTCSSRTRPTSGSSRPWPRASTCRWTRCSSTSTGTGTPRPRPCRSPSPRPSTRAGSRSATGSCFVAFGAGFTSGAVAMRVDGRPGARPCRRRRRPARGRHRPAAGRLGLGRPDPAGPRRDHGPAGRRRAARRRRPRRAGARARARTLSGIPQMGGTRMIDLTGKTALVTGGSRGIGRAIVLRLAHPGRRRRVQLQGNAEAAKADGRRDRGARPPGARHPGRRPRSRVGRGRGQGRPRGASARSTSSSTTPASPATT